MGKKKTSKKGLYQPYLQRDHLFNQSKQKQRNKTSCYKNCKKF